MRVTDASAEGAVAGAVFCVDILLLAKGRRTLSIGPAGLRKPATGHAGPIVS
nr:hypothetical protein GCM10025699_12780 [Microbacterium flavescens]